MEIDLQKYRPGRPVSQQTLQTQQMRALMLKRLKPRAKEVFDALIGAAVGVTMVDYDKEGEEFTYEKAPDVGAARLLFEYCFGKPTEKIEHSGGIGIVQLIASLDKNNANSG